MLQMLSRRDFEGFQPVRGRRVNVLEGLELHNGVLSPDEQVNMIDTIYGLVRQVAPAPPPHPLAWLAAFPS